ncbi:MAG: primosomal protein N' [Anaerolineales bacterium]|nr:primosomal protein N' [Anaerolineales bacterium]
MPTYLEIAVNVPQVADVFHYHLPEDLEGQVHVGHLVEVPFGQRRVQGVVLRFISEPSVSDTRPVSGLVDTQAVLTPSQISLAQELASITLAPLAACIGLMLPPGLGQQADTLYTISRKQPSVSEKPLTDLQKRLLTTLEKRGPLRGRQLDQAMPRVNWRSSARSLVRRGLLSTQSVLPSPTVKSKSVRTVQLACPPETAEAELPNLGRAGSAALKRRQGILRYLLREPGPVDVAWVYAESGGNLSDLRKLAERGLVTLGKSEVWRDPLEGMDFQITEPPPLTGDQMTCWNEIEAGIKSAGNGSPASPYLLHGVTGSGKTEIYLQAVEETIRIGKQAIVLVPEIALTPQTVRRFVSRFAGQVGLVHSRLSMGERYDTWRRARAGELSVVVGPRSALFTPFANLGLIVLDECHDTSYYQSEPPFYHARQAAVLYARLTGAVCLLGSATPDITSTFQAAQGKWHYLRLPSRILAHRQAVQAQVEKLGLASRYRPLEGEAETMELPPVQVIDMRGELKAGNSSIFSRALQSALGQVLEKNQQAILFLNRRGTATYVFCRDCGHTLKCPPCNLPLTFHSSLEALTCHHCGYKRKMPKTCPNCRGTRIRQYGTGTERVESEVKALYPQARTLRWDYETTRKKGSHEVILSHFSAHQADVLVGTQMLAKGLDLPMVTLVGVVLADVGLNLPDYSAGERTFQVLTQVAGRAGRSPLGGEVILQTFQPEHYVIQTAAGHNYRDFYHQEIKYRQQLGYPPSARLVRLEFRHTDAAQAERAAQKLASQVKRWIKEEGFRSTEIVGPVPCFYAQLGGFHRWQIVLRGPNPAALLRERTISGWRIEVNPPSLL